MRCASLLRIRIETNFDRSQVQLLHNAGDMDMLLNPAEIVALFRQDPSTEPDGGWQSLLVGL